MPSQTASQASSAVPGGTGRPLPRVDAVHVVSNIAWRATDPRDRHRVKPELTDQAHGVISVATARDPFVALTARYDDHLARHGDGMGPDGQVKLDSVSVQFMERAKRRAEHMRDHLILADDAGRATYVLDGMGVIDHHFDERAEEIATGTGRMFEDVRYESMREAGAMKDAYLVGLEELTHPGSMVNLDARLDQVAEHVDQTYARAGRVMPDEVRRAQLEVRGAKCVDALAQASLEPATEQAQAHQMQAQTPWVSELDQELARLAARSAGRDGREASSPSLG